ncbi:MAG: NAD/NADP octopine/nopaline dehydrogenase family protein [Promethearchaeota archaeon]
MEKARKRFPKFAVLGAGNGGQAFAAVLASKGFSVTLWNRSKSTVKAINKKGGIEITGEVIGFFKPDLVTTNLKKTLHNADVIMIVTPANAHNSIAYLCAPYLKEGQIIVLNPGRTGGALEVKYILDKERYSNGVIIAEAQTLIYISRALEPGKVDLVAIKSECPVAAFPATETIKVIQVLQLLHKEFVPAPNVLTTSIDNIGCIFHPAPLLFNAARAEDPNEKYDHYIDGISPTVGAFLEKMDAERLEIGKKLGIDVISARDWLCRVYNSPSGGNLYEVIQCSDNYSGIGAPDTLTHRYIFEDIPTGLVPLSSLGKALSVPTPAINAFINLVCVFYGIDFCKVGRTCEKLGLSDMSAMEIKSYVETGIREEIKEEIFFSQESLFIANE